MRFKGGKDEDSAVVATAKPSDSAKLVAASSSYRGPVPPVETIAGYEEILPGSADRLITMAEEQSAHRQSMEKRIVGLDETQQANELHAFNEGARNTRLGMFMGAGLVLVLATFGFTLLILERDAGGYSLIVGAIGVAITSVIWRPKSNDGAVEMDDDDDDDDDEQRPRYLIDDHDVAATHEHVAQRIGTRD